MDYLAIIIGVIALILLFKGVKIVPEQQAWIVERLGKFRINLKPGLNLIIPFIDNIAYKHTLKEQAIDMKQQTAITKDNVTVKIDGILYLKILDPIAASYGVNDPYYALSQLAQTTMRSEIGKINLDKTFEEREMLNNNIVNTINEAASSWGVQCMRYEICDIIPPDTVKQAMELQVAAERQKRAKILESEGDRQSRINRAEGQKQEVVLNSEAAHIDQINRAKGEAEAILAVAKATASSIEQIAKSANVEGGYNAIAMKIAQEYVEAFSNIAKTNNTLIIPSSASDVSSMVTQALSIFKSLNIEDKSNLKLASKDKEKSSSKKSHIKQSKNPWE